MGEVQGFAENDFVDLRRGAAARLYLGHLSPAVRLPRRESVVGGRDRHAPGHSAVLDLGGFPAADLSPAVVGKADPGLRFIRATAPTVSRAQCSTARSASGALQTRDPGCCEKRTGVPRLRCITIARR